ncbi:uncharacterized protein V1518DRAFT_415930 [Limtongia smithiae]|uniref:uncharacterized protein n=1 Tax=Limtongia smithiae TaxID=1125753 RepID=UPI0034CF34AE
MVARRFKKSAKRALPRGKKPMKKAAPSSDPRAANALSSHVGRQEARVNDGLTRKARKQERTHGPLGNVRVDHKAVVVKRKHAASKEAAKITSKALNSPQVGIGGELQLNTALKPAGIVHRRGKKGKVFVDDKDTLTKVLSLVTAKMDEQHATKIERAQQLEAIREAKRKEIEKREQDKVDKLENKKKEIKQSRRKRKGGPSADDDDDVDPRRAKRSKPGKRVRFAD